MRDIREMFLQQSMRDCEETYRDAVARRDAPAWDYFVVTAANEAQAEAYRAQIAQRLEAGLLPRQTRYEVIPDFGGKRIGSGGATLHVLREIARAQGGDSPFALQKILVLHSGGDSRRIPQYSACGKLFSHVPRALSDGRPSTLFDEFCVSLSCMPPRMNGGMLVMSGDVLLLFNALQIDLERTGAACLSIKAPVSVGTRHGVFLSDGNGSVKQFLHKQDEPTLRRLGAVNRQDQVDIDTGAIWLDERMMNAMYGLVKDSEADFEAFVNERVRLSFYGDFVYPMAEGSTISSYLAQAPENVPSAELEMCRRKIFERIGGAGLSLIRLSPAEFFHFGTSEEWRQLLLSGEERFGFLSWRRAVMSVGAGEHFAAVNSVIAPGASVGEGAAIEDCRILEGAVIGKGCIVSGADFDGVLPDGTVLHVLPVEGGNGYCARYYGVHDNPKDSLRFGRPIESTLWDAKLHPVCATPAEAISAALSGDEAPRRMSLAESFGCASMRHILKWQQRLTDEVRAKRVLERLSNGSHMDDVFPLLTQGEAGERQRVMLREAAETAQFPLKSRVYALLSRATGDAELDNACWQAVNDHMQAHAEVPSHGGVPRFAAEQADVSLPVRINWGGGWSDTPPYCLEHGGTVLNASCLLYGKRPVRAIARRIDSPIIRVESDDLGFSRDYTDVESLAPGNPSDPHGLCKAALCVAGIIGRGETGSLREKLSKMGGGILLRTEVSGIPKGSGLGTSSILSAAVARAIAQLFGQQDDDAHIAEQALRMEQLMNTGGGWQDQIGGLIPGIKLTSSGPGVPQRLAWRRIAMPDEAFAELSRRFALVFTGQRRLARNLLREIMGKAIANDPDTMRILSDIRRLAVLMAFELETGDIDAFARLTNEHWALSKRLDQGSSNTCIDHMVAVSGDLIDGALITGAGGGGFMSFILKKDATREMLAERLESVFQESGVRVWDATLER